MDELIDILTEFAPLETLVSIIAALLVLTGVVVSAVSLYFDAGLIDEIGLIGGILFVIAGALVYVFSSFIGELFDAVL